jgi:hypothetical protein
MLKNSEIQMEFTKCAPTIYIGLSLAPKRESHEELRSAQQPEERESSLASKPNTICNTQKPSPKHQCSEKGIEPAERDRAKWRGGRGRTRLGFGEIGVGALEEARWARGIHACPHLFLNYSDFLLLFI